MLILVEVVMILIVVFTAVSLLRVLRTTAQLSRHAPGNNPDSWRVPSRADQVTLPQTAAVMEFPDEVTPVHRALEENLRRAETAGDPLWLYDARAALYEYLPTTLTLHALAHGPGFTPELGAACADILTVAAARQVPVDDTAWQVQQRFLRSRAEETTRPNPLKL